MSHSMYITPQHTFSKDQSYILITYYLTNSDLHKAAVLKIAWREAVFNLPNLASMCVELGLNVRKKTGLGALRKVS
jgi:hypothetical protein